MVNIFFREESSNEDMQARSGVIFPFRFLGTGFYLAWIFTIHFSTALFETAEGAIESFILSNTTNFCCLILAALLAQKIAPISTKKPLIWLSGCSATGGTAMATFAGLASGFEQFFLVFGNALIGIGTALLILLWSELFSSLPRREVGIVYSGSFVLVAIVFYLVSILPLLQQAIVVLLLPLGSMFMFSSSVKLVPNQGEEIKETTASLWSFPVRPSILLAVYAFATTLSRQMAFESTEVSMLGLLAIAVVVLACNIFLYDYFDTRLLYKVTPPLLVAGFILITYFTGFDEVGSALINAGFSGFVILTLIVLSNISYTYGVTAIWLFGLTRAARVLASIIAASGYRLAAFCGFVDNMIIGSFSIILIVTCAMFFLSDKDFTSSWGLTPLPNRLSNTVEEFYDTQEGKCSIISRQYGLTQREEEVLVLLIKGKTVSKIEDTLFISNNTVKSHLRHLYAKLKVHSREEVLKLVNEL